MYGEGGTEAIYLEDTQTKTTKKGGQKKKFSSALENIRTNKT